MQADEADKGNKGSGNREFLPRDVEKEIQRTASKPWKRPKMGTTFGACIITEVLGDGGFSEVYLARFAGMDVALKVFRATQYEGDDRIEAARRFYHGAHSIRRLNNNHPDSKVVKLIDGPEFTRGYLWFTMEYYPDGDLSKFLEEGSSPVGVRIKIVNDLIEAISAGHKDNCVHRDLRPSNVLVRHNAGIIEAIVTDYDIAYHEPLLRQRNTTTILPAVQRILPVDVIGATDDRKRNMLRSRDIDLHALCVIVFDIFAAPSRLSLPGSRTPESIGSELTKSDKFLELPRTMRRQVAKFLSRGLAPDIKDRFSYISQIERAWNNIKDPPSVMASVSVYAIVIALIFNLFLIFDYSVMPASSLSNHLISLLIPGATVIITLLSLKNRIPAWLQRLRRYYSDAFPKWAQCIILFFALSLPFFTFFFTNGNERLHTYRINNGVGCDLVEAGQAISPIQPEGYDVSIDTDVQTIQCVEEGTLEVLQVHGHSYLSPKVRVGVKSKSIDSATANNDDDSYRPIVSKLDEEINPVPKSWINPVPKSWKAAPNSEDAPHDNESNICTPEKIEIEGKNMIGILIHCTANSLSVKGMDFSGVAFGEHFSFIDGPNMSGASLRGITAYKVDFGVYANLSNADLSPLRKRGRKDKPTILRYAVAHYGNFMHSNLTKAKLAYADLSFSDFSDATLDGASFWETIVKEAHFENASFKDAVIERSDFSSATGLQPSKLCEARFLGSSKLPGDTGVWSNQQESKGKWCVTQPGPIRRQMGRACPKHIVRRVQECKDR